MNRDQMKAKVSDAVEASWPQFQAEHPALAQVIDQTMLCEHVVESLAKDAAFNSAYETAVSTSAGAKVFADLVSRFVQAALARLR